MTEAKRTCFVIMPFAPELHYFYLYLQKHIEEKHAITCKRGDADVLTVPLLDKIKRYIDEADVLIADCSGRNPSVFYELGMAHAGGKKVILITNDPVEEAPTDIRHYEFIRYELNRHQEFLNAIDNALRHIFIDRYDDLYERANKTLKEFRRETGFDTKVATKEIFISRVVAAEQVSGLPSVEDELAVRQFVLPRIVSDNSDFNVMKQITEWITKKFANSSD